MEKIKGVFPWKIANFFRKVIFTEQIRAAASVLNVSREQVDPVNKRLKLNINKMRI